VLGTCLERDECLTRRDADPQLYSLLLGEVANRERRADGPLRIVLMRRRRTEERHHRVADELLDRAPVALELVLEAGLIGDEERGDVLGIHLLGA